MATSCFDVVVVGGGIAGSTLAGVLARAGLGVLVVERESHFRDRVRGEATWPWGVNEAWQLGLADVLRRAGCVELAGIEHYENQQVIKTDRWESTPMLSFSTPAYKRNSSPGGIARGHDAAWGKGDQRRTQWQDDGDRRA